MSGRDLAFADVDNNGFILATRSLKNEGLKEEWFIYLAVSVKLRESRKLLLYVSIGKVLDKKSYWSLEGLVDVFWAIVNFFVLL